MAGVTSSRPGELDVDVIVNASGDGSASFFLVGKITDIVIDEPGEADAGVAFNISLTDKNSKGIKAANGLSTQQVWTVDKNVTGKTNVVLSSAAQVGTWKIRVRYERGL